MNGDAIAKAVLGTLLALVLGLLSYLAVQIGNVQASINRVSENQVRVISTMVDLKTLQNHLAVDYYPLKAQVKANQLEIERVKK